MMMIARLSFVIFLMPGLGEQVIPVRVRLLVLLGIAVSFSGSTTISVPPIDPFAPFLGAMLSELFISIVLGVSLRTVIWVLTIVGSIVAQTIGLAQFLGVAMQFEAQTITANILSMAGATLLLSANYHFVVIDAFASLYEVVPVGALSAIDPMFVVDGIFSGFRFAVTLAWPFVAVSLVYNICLGFINKALPQLMVAFVGAPLMVGAGLALFAISVSGLLLVWRSRLPQMIGWI